MSTEIENMESKEARTNSSSSSPYARHFPLTLQATYKRGLTLTDRRQRPQGTRSDNSLSHLILFYAQN